ncbi:hypothetical protein JYT87_03070 [Nitrospira defluvii]|nr:hypothetical protein [Nitrospira defluvii]
MNLKSLIKLAIFIFLLGMPIKALAGEIVIIVNAENPISNLTPQEVKKYLLKEAISWPHGKKVRSVDRKGSPPERKVFLKAIVGMSTNQLEKYWVSQRYSKGVPLPPKLSGDQQIIEYVESFAGGISYVNAKSISESQGSGIKIVATFPF